MNKTDVKTSSEVALSKYQITWLHNSQGHETDACWWKEIHLIEAERDFNVKFHLDMELCFT